ncbi:MAG: right-handed parallel beta-helix repeat-containing protein, partial [Desulfobacteraceae bacterium]|nr:right-handed parallel beta-helix repeat-containing protein [Desulfobacteraceae bacterium]
MNAKFLAVALTLSVLFVTANESCACNPPDPDPPPSGNDSPIADLTTDWGYVILGRSVTLDGSASYDPDGSGGINNSGITKFEWDFTNNSSYDYYETPGYYPDGAPDGITTHLYNQPNTFTVKLRVTDSDDATDTGTCTVNVSEDSDNDDLPDGWETYYFGAPDVNDDNDDFDGDGYNNIIEYLHGTDPSNPADPDGSPPPTTIRVPDNIDSIQRAINGSINGDTIVVSQGRYYENIDLNGKKITLTSTSPNNPDVVAATIIDANGLGPVVTFGPSEETDSALRGLTITGADDPDTEHYGGIYCSHSSAQITNCVIYGNTSKWKDGGGIYMEDSSAQITNCVIYENACKDGGSGGGIYIDCSSLLVKNCIFSDNEGGGAGGGIYISSGDLSITVESCAFLGNEADKGGGICDTSGHTSVPVTIKNCVFIGNIAIAQAQSHEGKGGAIYNEGLAGCCKVVDIYNCTFLENTAEAENSSIGGKGGAICNYPKDWQESATLIVNIYNCILWGNQAIQDGGGPICGHDIYNSYSDTTLNFCNFEENADDYLYHKGSDPGAIEPNEENCIFGDGSNPLFVNSNNPAGPDDVFGTSDDGLRLQPNSPCVDAGIDAAVDGNVPETGIFGQERVDIPYGDGTSITDIGAYETPIDRMYVNENATFNPDASGLFWDDAFVYLQDALKQAKDFDFAGEIWVAAGTYYPDRNKDNTEGTDDRNSSFELINGVKLYGGFTGNEIYLHRRSWIVNETILSGDINEPGDSNDNSLHVVVGADSAILDGFTITGGNANGSGSNGWGGGIFCFYVSPTISNCTITENTGEDSSGGMFNGVSNSTVTNCTITNNSGGGMLNAESSPTISNCTIAKNTNKSDGGGIYNVESSPIISNCTITENTSYYSGGGIYNDESNPTLTNCTFSGNTANNSGGGMYHYGGTLELTNCTFSGNSAGGKGGGLYNSMCSLTMTNCTFSD